MRDNDIEFCLVCNKRLSKKQRKFCCREHFYEYGFSDEHRKAISKAQKGNQAFKGKYHTQEAKDKISSTMTGRKYSKERCKNIGEGVKRSREEGKNPGHHIPHTIKARKKMSFSITGKDNYDINEPYGYEFTDILREEIRERDGHTCQGLDCGVTKEQSLEKYGCKLDVHHVDYDKQNNDRNNLITLCHSCHSKTNQNREYWTNYFQEKVQERMENQGISIK